MCRAVEVFFEIIDLLDQDALPGCQSLSRTFLARMSVLPLLEVLAREVLDLSDCKWPALLCPR